MKVKGYILVPLSLLISAFSGYISTKSYEIPAILVILAVITYFLVKNIFEKYVYKE